jgi:hypothetical protein
MYPGMPVIVHHAGQRFSPEYSRVEKVEGNLVTITSGGGSQRYFRADTQALDGDFGYSMYFNTLSQDIREGLRDEAEEGLRRFRAGQQVPA